MRTRIAMSGLLVLLVLFAAACSLQEPDITVDDQLPAHLVVEDDADADEPADGGEPAASVRFVAVDIDYSEAPATVPAGTVEFELVNDGGILHDVVIEELGNRQVVVAQGGETTTGTVTLEPGTYTYFCSVPAHRATMEGTFTVE